jgi:hypothetical protein
MGMIIPLWLRPTSNLDQILSSNSKHTGHESDLAIVSNPPQAC